jgi:hypothetical protein
MAFSFADFFKSELASSLFASSGSQPLQTELCENPNFITQGYHADAFRGACLSSVIHIAHAHWHCIQSYPQILPYALRLSSQPLKSLGETPAQKNE